MADDQQPAVEAATGDNVMGKVLGTFDVLVDKATAAVGGGRQPSRMPARAWSKRAARSLERSARKPPARPAASAP